MNSYLGSTASFPLGKESACLPEINCFLPQQEGECLPDCLPEMNCSLPLREGEHLPELDWFLPGEEGEPGKMCFLHQREGEHLPA